MVANHLLSLQSAASPGFFYTLWLVHMNTYKQANYHITKIKIKVKKQTMEFSTVVSAPRQTATIAGSNELFLLVLVKAAVASQRQRSLALGLQ